MSEREKATTEQTKALLITVLYKIDYFRFGSFVVATWR